MDVNINSALILYIRSDVSAPVHAEARVCLFGADREFLPVRNRPHAARADSRLFQRGFHLNRALVAEGEIVLGRTKFVAVALDHNPHVGMLFEKLRIGLDGRNLIGADCVIVEVEEDVETVCTIGEIAFGTGWRRLICRRGNHGYARIGLLHAPRTLGREMVCCRLGRCDALRSVGLHRANLGNGDVGRV